MKFLDNNTIEITPNKRNKKITGTRLGSILNMNPWSTPFQAWCEITKTYEQPFLETIYTLAGKTIEHKQIEFLTKNFFITSKTPSDVYGIDYFKKTYGDFFKNEPIFGGMWDAISVDKNGNDLAIIECKTTKRVEDWVDDIPPYYALQASLYSYLKGLDDVIFVVSFLNDKTYIEIEKLLNNYSTSEIDSLIRTKEIDKHISFEPTKDNTIIKTFKISEKYPNFDDLINKARLFYENHVLKGISPTYDLVKDKSILDYLKSTTISSDTKLDELLKTCDELTDIVDKKLLEIKDTQSKLDETKLLIKDILSKELVNGIKTASAKTTKYEYRVAQSIRNTINKEQLEKDGILNRYLETKETIILTRKEANKK